MRKGLKGRIAPGLIAVLALCRAGSALADPAELVAVLESYRSLHAKPTGVRVKDGSARLGHLEMSFEQGALYPLQGARGEALGLFFEGKGRYVYRSEDPADRQVIEANLKRLSRAPIYSQDKVSDTFDRLVLFFAVPAFETLWAAGPGGEATPAPELSAASESTFARIWRRIGQTYLEYDHLAAEARLDGGTRQYVYAEIEGERETIGYSFDRVRDFEERLFLFRKVQGVDIRFHESVSAQPVDGGKGLHPAPFLLKDVQIDISTQDNREATIVSDLILEASEDGLRVARLRLMNNRDPVHYNWASQKNALAIRRLTDDAGEDRPFSHRYNEVLVELAEPSARGRPVRLHVETRGDILSGLHGERYNNYFDLLGVDWYPRSDAFYAAGHTYHLKVRTREPFVPIASGRTLSAKENGGVRELVTAAERAVDEAVVFAGKYVTHEETFGKTTIRAHAYAAANHDLLEKIPRTARQFLSFYESTLGPYPFGDLDIVEAPSEQSFLAFGIAPPGIVILTSEAYNARRDPWTRAASHGINWRLAHEVAHQWFPHQAMPASERDAWLSESMAEYLSAVAVGSARPEEKHLMGFPEMLTSWRFEARACKDAGPIAAASMLSGPSAARDRQYLLYSRGPLVLHMLRVMAGNDGFFAILRRLLEMGGRGPVSTDDFRAAAEEVTKTDLHWFFEDWYGKGGIPEIRVRHEIRAYAGGGLMLTGRAEQADGPGFRRILIPLLLDYGDDRREVRLVFQDEPIKEFRFDLKERPKKISVDPFLNNLAAYK